MWFALNVGFAAGLRRHLGVAHGLEPAAYYARWELPADQPIPAPAYSARRSAMAKKLGLGRGRARRTAERTPRRRSRSRARDQSAT